MTTTISLEKSIPGYGLSPGKIVFRKGDKEMSILLSQNATWIESIGMFQEGQKDIFRNNVERENIQDILEWFMK